MLADDVAGRAAEDPRARTKVLRIGVAMVVEHDRRRHEHRPPAAPVLAERPLGVLQAPHREVGIERLVEHPRARYGQVGRPHRVPRDRPARGKPRIVVLVAGRRQPAHVRSDLDLRVPGDEALGHAGAGALACAEVTGEAPRGRPGVVVEEENELAARLTRREIAGRPGAGARLREGPHGKRVRAGGHVAGGGIVAVDHHDDLERRLLGRQRCARVEHPRELGGPPERRDRDGDRRRARRPVVHVRAGFSHASLTSTVRMSRWSAAGSTTSGADPSRSRTWRRSSALRTASPCGSNT